MQSVSCNRCGKSVKLHADLKPQGKYRCLLCRRIEPLATGPYGPRLTPVTCATCLVIFQPNHRDRKYCSRACSAKRYGGTPSSYFKRARLAPGLRERQRRKLLATWRKQGRTCTYCDSPVQCVDHVVPLKLGGTNFEGNLTPSCWPCNAKKGAKLLTTWRAS